MTTTIYMYEVHNDKKELNIVCCYLIFDSCKLVCTPAVFIYKSLFVKHGSHGTEKLHKNCPDF